MKTFPDTKIINFRGECKSNTKVIYKQSYPTHNASTKKQMLI